MRDGRYIVLLSLQRYGSDHQLCLRVNTEIRFRPPAFCLLVNTLISTCVSCASLSNPSNTPTISMHVP